MAAKRSEPGLDGLLPIDKPAGPTSHDLVSRVRRALGVRRVGHAGTLDPFATGLLLCCVGRATRLVRFLTGCDKRYSGIVRFGFATDTGDSTGRPLAEPVEPALEAAALREAVAALTGAIDQVPPMYSAKKQGGRRLYELARQGVEVEREPVRVRVSDWSRGELEDGRLPFEVTVSAGTYVRVLAEELGRLAGCPAHLESLRRESSGELSVADALTVGPGRDDGPGPEAAREALVPLARIPLPLPHAAVEDPAAVQRLLHGQVLEPGAWSGPEAAGEGDELAVRDPAGRLLAVGRLGTAGGLEPGVVLAEPERA